MLDHFIVPFSGLNHSVSNIDQLMRVYYELSNEDDQILNRVKRRYQIYEKRNPEKKPGTSCPSNNGMSVFTFLNFMIGVVSVAANVIPLFNFKTVF